MKHTASAAVKVVAILLVVCLSLFRIAKYKVNDIRSVRPFTADTVALVPLVIGTNGVF